MRNRNFQSQVIELECGHFASEVTSFYRLQRDRLACLRGSWIAKGIWCPMCKATDQPKRWVMNCAAEIAEAIITSHNNTMRPRGKNETV